MVRKDVKTVIVVLAAIFAVLLLILPFPGSAGTLDPPPEAVDASGNPVPTTPEPHSWSKKIEGADRFKILGEVIPGNPPTTQYWGFLDRETGLVWSNGPFVETTFIGAQNNCNLGEGINLPNRPWGWRVPTAMELLSLKSTSAVPPFMVAGSYWSSSDYIGFSNYKVRVTFDGSYGWYLGVSMPEGFANYVICVRGGD